MQKRLDCTCHPLQNEWPCIAAYSYCKRKMSRSASANHESENRIAGCRRSSTEHCSLHVAEPIRRSFLHLNQVPAMNVFFWIILSFVIAGISHPNVSLIGQRLAGDPGFFPAPHISIVHPTPAPRYYPKRACAPLSSSVATRAVSDSNHAAVGSVRQWGASSYRCCQ